MYVIMIPKYENAEFGEVRTVRNTPVSSHFGVYYSDAIIK